MNLFRVLNLLCIVIGGAIVIFVNDEVQQNTYILIGGIALLIFGIYRTSQNVPSKFGNQEEAPLYSLQKR